MVWADSIPMRTLRAMSLLWLALTAIFTQSAFAQHMNAKDGPCQGPSNTAGGYQCFNAAYKRADAELNRVYQRVESVVEDDDLKRLKEVQRLWINFRDANCAAEYKLYVGGSAAPTVKVACLEAMTRHRSEELQTMYGWRLEKWGK